MPKDELARLLFSAGVSLAGLILVFLGFVLTSYSLYEAVERSAVRPRYRVQAVLAFSGFCAAVLTALLGLLSDLCPSALSFALPGGLAFLAVSLSILIVLGVMVVKEVS